VICCHTRARGFATFVLETLPRAQIIAQGRRFFGETDLQGCHGTDTIYSDSGDSVCILVLSNFCGMIALAVGAEFGERSSSKHDSFPAV